MIASVLFQLFYKQVSHMKIEETVLHPTANFVLLFFFFYYLVYKDEIQLACYNLIQNAYAFREPVCEMGTLSLQ